MAQFTTLIAHSDHEEEFLARFPSAKGGVTCFSEEEALQAASEKFLTELQWNGDYELDEWLVQPEELSAYEIYDEVTHETVIGWEIDSI